MSCELISLGGMRQSRGNEDRGGKESKHFHLSQRERMNEWSSTRESGSASLLR